MDDETPAPTVRERLLAGLETSIRERGYAATTVAHVVGAAGTSKRTFYEEFATKEECLLAHFRLFHAGIAEEIARAAPLAPSSYDATVVGVETYFNAFVSEPELTRAHLLEILTLGEPALRAREEMLDVYVSAMQRTMGSSRDDRPAQRLDRLRAVGILGGINEIALLVIGEGGPSAGDALGDAVAFVRAVISDLPEA